MFNSKGGFIPEEITTLITNYYETHKEVWNQYDLTEERFKGSKEYELYYTAAQVDAQQQAYYSETFEKLKSYITSKNEKIKRPTPINDRIISHFYEKYGFRASVRPPELATAGILAICLDYSDDSPALAQSIADDILKFCAVGGIWTEGDVTKISNASNGQPFDISWSKSEKKTCELKYTITRSRNSKIAEIPAIDIRSMVLKNFKERSSLGLDVEPQTYLTKIDLPWSASILGERKIGTDTAFTSNVYKSDYRDDFSATLELENIIVVDL